ncbi:hypothetical protein D9M73_188090 [compost metagenome]
MLHLQPVHQHLADELVGGQLTQAAVERQAEDEIDALLAQQFELLAQAGQAHRRGVRGKELARLRLEDHHATRDAKLQRALAQTPQDRLVTKVDAVEIADGGDAAPGEGPQVM